LACAVAQRGIVLVAETPLQEVGMQPTNEATPGGVDEVVASYSTYPEAQRAVDALSDAGFPVETVEIVGHDVRTVEQVTGRLTNARAAAAGAASGAWFGLFIGLLVGLFTTGAKWIGLVLGGLLIGAIWGAAYGFVAHWMTRGQRDFSSVSSLVAGRYDVTAPSTEAERARQILGSPPLTASVTRTTHRSEPVGALPPESSVGGSLGENRYERLDPG
jgi:hypothetical protein